MAEGRDALIQKGWKQFSIINPADHPALLEHAHINLEPDDLLLVISQTCDLVSGKDSEPFFEVACLRSLKSTRQDTHPDSKNPRRMEVTLSLEDQETHFYLLAHERFHVKQELLHEINPAEAINDEDTLDALLDWIVARYNRVAFPDSFDRRWKTRRKTIEKTIKKLERITDIYLKITPFDEVEDNEEYELEILLLMSSRDYQDPDVLAEYEELASALEDQLAKCDGINVETADVESRGVVSLEQIQSYKHWDYRYLSHRDPEAHAK